MDVISFSCFTSWEKKDALFTLLENKGVLLMFSSQRILSFHGATKQLMQQLNTERFL